MFVRFVAVLAVSLFASSAFAEPTDPAAMQKAIAVLQIQRNNALNEAAGLQVQIATLSEENSKLKSEIEDLKKKEGAAK